MYIFVGWSTASRCEEAKRRNSEESSLNLPDLTELQRQEIVDQYDSLNSDLLAVQLYSPVEDRVIAYKQAARLRASMRLPVAVATRNYLLTTFKGNWSNSLFSAGYDKLVFVGFDLSYFMPLLRDCCAALGSPLPVDFVKTSRLLDLDMASTSAMLRASMHYRDAEETQRLLSGWCGVGTDSGKELSLAMTAGYLYGYSDVQSVAACSPVDRQAV